MTLPRIAQAVLPAILFTYAFTSVEVNAEPITYAGSGTISSGATISGTGFSGFLNPGDNYTFNFTVDPSLPSSQGNGTSPLGAYRTNVWNTGTSASLTINGETFTIGNHINGSSNSANTFEYDFGLEQLRYSADEYTDQHSSPGSATSTLAGVDRVRLTFMVTDDFGTTGNSVLDFDDPQFPTETYLSDWNRTYMGLSLYSIGSSASYVTLTDNNNPMTSFNVFDGEAVPAPSAFLLLGFGLLGLGMRRWTA